MGVSIKPYILGLSLSDCLISSCESRHCSHLELLECQLECQDSDHLIHHQIGSSCSHHCSRHDAPCPRFQTCFVREELVKPERNIPLAVIVSVITVIVGYMLTNVSYYTVLTAADVLASQAVAVNKDNMEKNVEEFCTPSFPQPYIGDPYPGFLILLWNHEWRNFYFFKDIVCSFKGRSMASSLLHDPYSKAYTAASSFDDDYLTLKLQILLKVVQQEIRTY
ncbi:hypothetical protein JD844_028565 [Phrynosoma platyrhinos]|uniref:Uncharacterized protein n=1 Tax=Phrynosoma platyrhinos TaxID=52577 RepID=A0ABQ7SI73_PHRPL|nr:hypothetical protein JD844_028565 [Phrynosoma platyrhinos]